jgi:8-oxo-dGTP pyrophosphatase MutT (NUDIX family)
MNTIHRYYSHNRHYSSHCQCTNCGEYGHILRNCPSPITSYGIIAARRPEGAGETMDEKFCSAQHHLTAMETPNSYEFLLIQRRDSLSFVEFIRGKYSMSNMPYLQQLFRAMTRGEHQRILTLSFNDLWESVWGTQSTTHKTDYDNSEARYNELRGPDGKGIERMIAENPSVWDEPEWGFPKGRRNPHESDIRCALREFEEETNIRRTSIQLVSNIQPLTETFFGSNQIHYCHKYYVGICPSNTIAELDTANPHMTREIGAIRWLTLEQALQKIRPDNVEKREILLKTGRILRNFCPVPHHIGRHRLAGDGGH